MEVGGVQVQYQPYTQDPSRQLWKNTNQNGEQQFKQRRNGDSSGNAMINRTNHPTTPKSAQFPKSPNFATFINKNSNSSQQGPLKSPSNNNKNKSNNNNNNNNNSSNNLSRSPPKGDKNITTILQQKNTNFNRSAPKPLNLSKATQLQNLGKVPQSAVFPQKINRNYNLPNPPKTATFPKNSNGFPKDIRQSTLRFPTTPSSATALMYNEQYLNVLDQSRFRYYNPNPMPARFATSSNCSQVELGLGTPMAALCHPDDSDSQESSPQTPIFLSSENFAGSADVYDFYNLQHHPHEDELLLDDNQKYYHYYYHYFDQSQEYIPPSTPTSNIHHHHHQHHQHHQQKQQQQRSNITHERRKSVFGGPMKVHPDAVLPIRQPKGPEMARNFTTRIRRKAVNKLHAATAERRSKSAADRRKSAMF